jgi:hypothetical protein
MDFIKKVIKMSVIATIFCVGNFAGAEASAGNKASSKKMTSKSKSSKDKSSQKGASSKVPLNTVSREKRRLTSYLKLGDGCTYSTFSDGSKVRGNNSSEEEKLSLLE